MLPSATKVSTCHNSIDRNTNRDQLYISLNTADTTDLLVMKVQTGTYSLLRSTRLVGNSVKESCLKKTVLVT